METSIARRGWGDDPPAAGHANWSASKRGRPDDVGRYPANGYALYDMAGNVWEFVSDRAPGEEIVRYQIRGGSYGAGPPNLRVRYRDTHPAGGAGDHVGFRCAYR